MRNRPRQNILLLAMAVLFLAPAFLLYNANGTASAQQEPEIVCESAEIPVGAAVDASLILAEELLNNAAAAISGAVTEIALAEQLLLLPDQCLAENCGGGCSPDTRTISCGSSPPPAGEYAAPCWPGDAGKFFCYLDDPNNRVHCQFTGPGPDDYGLITDPCPPDLKCVPPDGICSACTEDFCDISPCSGDPCPRDAINMAADAIISSYDEIKRVKENTTDLFEEKFTQLVNGKDLWKYCTDKTKINLMLKGAMKDESLKDLIVCLLDESRRGLSRCVTPDNLNYLEERQGTLKCQDASALGALSEKQRQECYFDNFFCCRFQ